MELSSSDASAADDLLVSRLSLRMIEEPSLTNTECSASSIDGQEATEPPRLSVKFNEQAHTQYHDEPSLLPSLPNPSSQALISHSLGTTANMSMQGTFAGDASSHSPKGSKPLHAVDLRSNLTREQRDRDPLFFYEIVQTLGAGSMGSVAWVKKRKHAVGGSSRKEIQDLVRRQNRHKQCLEIPFIGGVFRMCFDGILNGSTPLTGQDSQWAMPWFRFKHQDPLISLDESASPSTEPLLSRAESAESFGSVTSIESRKSRNRPAVQYAMKSIHLNRVTDQKFLTELRNEIAVLKKLDHPHIVRAIETFEHRHQIFIIMELCSGGDLYSRDPYSEEEAARIISSILSAVAYMHSKQILHRDIKYENILFVNKSPKAEVKLIDFGLSKVYGDNTELTEGVGTIYTMAPEVLRGSYSEKADVWSIGVVAFMLLSSQMPFYGRKRHHIVEQIMNAQFDFRGRRWKRISDQAKAFVEELLVLDVDERLDARTAMSCTWLNRRFAATTRGPDVEEECMARHAMLRYAGYTKLKKMALMVVAHKSSSEEIGILRKIFQKFDKKRDGSIGFDDFCSALSEFGHSEKDLKEMFEAVDLDGSGKIRYTEFLAATIEAQGAISEERLAEAFDRLDEDDSGKISAKNLAEILGKDFPRDEIDQIIAEAKVTKDNQISYAEFLSLWEDKQEQDRVEQLRLLDTEMAKSVQFDPEMNSFRGGSNSDMFSSSSLEEFDSAEARFTFMLEKRDNTRRASCKELKSPPVRIEKPLLE